jgi:hypothetical protein
MRTFIRVQNEQAEQFELTVCEFNFENTLVNITEKSFHTDFIFEGITEEEEDTLENIKNNLN